MRGENKMGVDISLYTVIYTWFFFLWQNIFITFDYMINISLDLVHIVWLFKKKSKVIFIFSVNSFIPFPFIVL